MGKRRKRYSDIKREKKKRDFKKKETSSGSGQVQIYIFKSSITQKEKIPMGSRTEERQPCGTVKCNSGCAILLPRLLVIDYEGV